VKLQASPSLCDNNVKILQTILLLSLIFNQSTFAQDYDELALHKRWQRLLQYKKSMLGSSYSSRTDDKRFFLDPNGYWDPVAELKTSVAKFQEPVTDEAKRNLHTQCRFPARYKFVKKHFKNIQFKDVTCNEFSWWYDQIGAKSIALIFSSYYASNPASMFGHTLLKLVRAEKGMGGITDLGLNFAAETGSDTGITYIMKGLMGGYLGKFSTLPYYNKLNDYINGESRDVWEYRLKLNFDQVDWIVKHIWELKNNAYFDYYFLDVNCSFLLLTILEVGNLDWNLTHGFFFYALPVDTVKRMTENNAVEQVYFRPSFRKKLYSHYHSLDDGQKETFKNLIKNKLPMKDVTVPEIIDTYTAYLRYQRYESGDDPEFMEATKKKIRKAHLHRAKLGVVSEPEIYNKPTDPLDSHHAYRMGLSSGYNTLFKEFYEYQFRFGVHDMSTNSKGLPPFSNLEFVGAKFRYYSDEQQLHLHEFTFINLQTINDWDLLTKDLSWGASLKVKTPHDLGVNNRYMAEIRPNVGFAKHIFNKKVAVASFFILDMQYGPALNYDYYRISPGLKLGILGNLSSRLTFNLWGTLLQSLDKNYDESLRYEVESSLAYSFNQSFELGIYNSIYSSSLNYLDDARDTKLNLHYFF
jgi:hypothetical protein